MGSIIAAAVPARSILPVGDVPCSNRDCCASTAICMFDHNCQATKSAEMGLEYPGQGNGPPGIAGMEKMSDKKTWKQWKAGSCGRKICIYFIDA